MSLPTATAISVSTAVNSIGINTHIDFNNYGYQNLAVTEAAINYLGVKNLRDSAQNAADVGVTGLWQKVANATGAKFDDYMGEGSPALDTADLALAQQLAHQGILNAIEGGNENDAAYGLAQGNSIAWTANFQKQVYAAAHSLGLPVINMSFGSGWTAANNWQGDYDKVGDLSAYADYANAHTYPNVGQGTDATILRLNADALLAAHSRPVITTEIGWNTTVTDQTTAAKYVLDAVFDGIKDGDVRTYFYALFDDGSGKFGLMNQDGSAKPAGAALHNLTTILADPGAPLTGSLAYSLSGTTAHDNTLLMEKSNGTFELAIWNETDAAHNLTLTLGTAAQTVSLYDPMVGSSAVQTSSNASGFTLGISDHPVIVEIMPGNATALAPAAPAASISDDGNVGMLYSLFNRAPDPAGLAFWRSVYTNDVPAAAKAAGILVSLAETPIPGAASIADGFTNSTEFQNAYGALSDAAFVSRLYVNVLGRTPATAEVTAWTDDIHNGMSRAVVLVGLAESPENIAKVAAAGWLLG